MADGLEYSIKIENNEPVIRAELDKDIERALYAIGVKAVEGAVRSISGQYTPSNQAVDTGRLRASISFITAQGDMDVVPQGMPKAVKTPQTPKEGHEIGDNKLKNGDRLSGSAEANTVVIGTNVEYGIFVHTGARGRAGRPFLREGIDNTKGEMEEIVKDILQGGGQY